MREGGDMDSEVHYFLNLFMTVYIHLSIYLFDMGERKTMKSSGLYNTDVDSFIAIRE